MNKKFCFSEDSLLECINYLIDNSYVVYNNKVYRQVIGIPMGTNSAPQIANIYLHVYEYDYIAALIEKKDEENLSKLKNIFRYQDDLISFNDFGHFGNVLEDIYPREMKVNCTNVSRCKCNYLDVCISIYRGKFRSVLYDKRKDYEFDVISYPFLDGNIPKNLSYGVFISQLTRFANVNTTVEDFYSNISDLVNKLENHGFNKSSLRKKFVKYYHSRMNNWCKFGVDIFDQVIMNFN